MMNLNEMTSKQLKELGKQNGVKNWWNLSKAALIAALTVEVETVNPEVISDSEPDTYQTEVNDNEPEKAEPSKIKKPNLKIHDLTFGGKTQSIRAWAEELEMPWPTLYDRINRCGWTTEEALTIPLGSRRKAKKEEIA